MKRPLFAAALCFAAAWAVFSHFGFWAAAAAGALLLAAAVWGRQAVRRAAVLLLGCLLAEVIFSLVLLWREQLHIVRFAGQTACCELEILHSRGSFYTAAVRSADGEAVRGLRLSFWEQEMLFEGQRLSADVQFSSADTASRRGGFTLRGKLLSFHTLYENETVRFAVGGIKRRITASLRALLNENDAALCICAVTGDTSALSPALLKNLRRAGLGDLLAVSGMHVSLMLSLAALPFGRRRNGALVLCAAAGVLLAIFYDGSASVVRAVVMQLAALAGSCIARKNDPLSSLGLSVLFLCLWRPYVVFELGFLMSVSCCMGIFLLAQPLGERMERFLFGRGKIGRALLRLPLQQLLVSVCVGLALLPCSLAAGFSVSLTGPLAAMLTGFVMLPQLIAALLAALFHMLVPFGAPAILCGAVAALCSRWVSFVAGIFSRLPFASVSLHARWMQLAALFSLLVLCLAAAKKLRVGVALLCAVLVLLVGSVSQSLAVTGGIAVYRLQNGIAVVHNGQCAVIPQQNDEETLQFLLLETAEHCLPQPDYAIINEMPHLQWLGDVLVCLDEAPWLLAGEQKLMIYDILQGGAAAVYILPDGRWKAVRP
ncbi:MAG: ComEC/Rec2 family competence protein [Oscillospiraceae bacterium]|nr:ComEC/Rec2 family competence protein [Oscillospiraceae bacterium]